MNRNLAGVFSRLREFLGRTRRTRDEYEFQPGYLEIVERPPAPWARGTAWLLIGTVVIALVWAILGFLDIHASSTGRLIVSSYTKVVQAHQAGRSARSSFVKASGCARERHWWP